MSWQQCEEPDCQERAGDIELLIRPHEKDLGGFSVRRLLPAGKRRLVGPYIFFDHMGPARLPVGKGVDVRPHPHIGLSTVTWLFDGEIMHRDSLGHQQPIRPGAVNFMTAGSGIVHSERTPSEARVHGAPLHGIQLWLALPAVLQETPPQFTHYPAASIPVADTSGVRVHVVIGDAYGAYSPVAALSPTLYVEAQFAEPSELELPDNYRERAVYVVDGEIAVGDCAVSAGEMAVIRPRAGVSIHAEMPARAMLIGGDPFPEERAIWWNFVSTSKQRIEKAKQDWREGRFPPVPGDSEFIPLPD